MSTFKTSISIIALVAGLSFFAPQASFAQGAGTATDGGQTAQKALDESTQNELDRLQREIGNTTKEIKKLREDLETEKGNLGHFERVSKGVVSHFKKLNPDDDRDDRKVPVVETLTPDEIEEGVTPESGQAEAKKNIDDLQKKIDDKMKERNETTTKRQAIFDKATGATGGPAVQQAGGGAQAPGGEKACRNGLEDAARIKEYRDRLRWFENEIASRESQKILLDVDFRLVAADADLNSVTKKARLDELESRIRDNNANLDNYRTSAKTLRELLKELLDIFCPPNPPMALPFSPSTTMPEQPGKTAENPPAKPADKTATRTAERTPTHTVERKKGSPRKPDIPTAKMRRTKPDETPRQSTVDPVASQALSTVVGIGIGIGVGHAMDHGPRMGGMGGMGGMGMGGMRMR